MTCYLRLLNISYKDHVTDEEVRRKIHAAIGVYDELWSRNESYDGMATFQCLLV